MLLRSPKRLLQHPQVLRFSRAGGPASPGERAQQLRHLIGAVPADIQEIGVKFRSISDRLWERHVACFPQETGLFRQTGLLYIRLGLQSLPSQEIPGMGVLRFFSDGFRRLGVAALLRHTDRIEQVTSSMLLKRLAFAAALVSGFERVRRGGGCNIETLQRVLDNPEVHDLTVPVDLQLVSRALTRLSNSSNDSTRFEIEVREVLARSNEGARLDHVADAAFLLEDHGDDRLPPWPVAQRRIFCELDETRRSLWEDRLLGRTFLLLSLFRAHLDASHAGPDLLMRVRTVYQACKRDIEHILHARGLRVFGTIVHDLYADWLHESLEEGGTAPIRAD